MPTTLRASESVGLGWVLRICISDKFPGDTDAMYQENDSLRNFKQATLRMMARDNQQLKVRVGRRSEILFMTLNIYALTHKW